HAVDYPQRRLGRRHEAAHVRHDRNQRDLPQIGRFAGHVRPGDEQELSRIGVGIEVVGHELARTHSGFEHRMPSLADAHSARGIHRGPHVAAPARDFGQRRERIELAHRARRFEYRAALSLQVAQQFGEELQLQLAQARLRRKNLAFQFLQSRRGEALGADQRLLALVVGRSAIEMALGYLDVVAEDVVVTDLERGNAGARALGRLQLRDYRARARGERAQLVDLGVEAAMDDVAVARIYRRLVADGRVDLLDQGRIRRNARRQRTDEAAFAIAQPVAKRGYGLERLRQTQAIARRCTHRAEPPGEPL